MEVSVDTVRAHGFCFCPFEGIQCMQQVVKGAMAVTNVKRFVRLGQLETCKGMAGLGQGRGRGLR